MCESHVSCLHTSVTVDEGKEGAAGTMLNIFILVINVSSYKINVLGTVTQTQIPSAAENVWVSRKLQYFKVIIFFSSVLICHFKKLATDGTGSLQVLSCLILHIVLDVFKLNQRSNEALGVPPLDTWQ